MQVKRLKRPLQTLGFVPFTSYYFIYYIWFIKSGPRCYYPSKLKREPLGSLSNCMIYVSYFFRILISRDGLVTLFSFKLGPYQIKLFISEINNIEILLSFLTKHTALFSKLYIYREKPFSICKERTNKLHFTATQRKKIIFF